MKTEKITVNELFSGIGAQVSALERLGIPFEIKHTSDIDHNAVLAYASIHCGLTEELISVPEGVQPKEFFNTEITFTDTLPKDRLIELQQIQLELQLGLESKQGAMRRLNKENITYLLEEIEQERLEEEAKMLELQQKQSVMNAETQMMASEVQSKLGASQTPKLNSGMTNGETPVEQVRKETTGSNGMSNE